MAFHERLKLDRRFVPGFAPELDIVVFALSAPGAAKSSALCRKVFAAAARRDLHLAVADLPSAFFGGEPADTGTRTVLRSVLMKPEHLDWLDRIWGILDVAAEECGASRER